MFIFTICHHHYTRWVYKNMEFAVNPVYCFFIWQYVGFLARFLHIFWPFHIEFGEFGSVAIFKIFCLCWAYLVPLGSMYVWNNRIWKLGTQKFYIKWLWIEMFFFLSLKQFLACFLLITHLLNKRKYLIREDELGPYFLVFSFKYEIRNLASSSSLHVAWVISKRVERYYYLHSVVSWHAMHTFFTRLVSGYCDKSSEKGWKNDWC